MPTGSKRHKEGADGTTPGRRKRARTHKLLDEDWGLEKSNKLPPPAPPIPGSLPQMEAAPLVAPPETPSPPQVPPEVPPEAPPEAPPGGKPDDNSLSIERVAQGLPPMQVAPSVEHLYEGHLGEVSKGWGRDLTPPPPQQATLARGKKWCQREPRHLWRTLRWSSTEGS